MCIRDRVCLWHRKLEVEVLDALSIGVSLLRSDFNTAGSVMFLLNVGALLEEMCIRDRVLFFWHFFYYRSKATPHNSKCRYGE